MLKKIILIILATVILCCFCSCSLGFEREYYDDIVITLQDREGVLVIKEWEFLLGSGAEIYYRYKDQKPILLGKTLGGDDGYCPFKNGNYEITQNADSVDISLPYGGEDKIYSFDLPNEEELAKKNIKTVFIAVSTSVILLAGVRVFCMMLKKYSRRSK